MSTGRVSEFLAVLTVEEASGFAVQPLARAGVASCDERSYETPRFGDVSLLHFAGSHVQLLPYYYRHHCPAKPCSNALASRAARLLHTT